MIVCAQVELPEDGSWTLSLPEYPPELCILKEDESVLKEWVWKHGKDQLLAKMKFTLATTDRVVDAKATSNDCQVGGSPDDDDDDEGKSRKQQHLVSGVPTSALVENITAPRREDTPPTCGLAAEIKQPVCKFAEVDNGASELRMRLDLMERLQTVEQDFLEKVQEVDGRGRCLLDQNEREVKRSFSTENGETHKSAVTMACESLLGSVMAWSGTDYGFVATVEEERHPSKQSEDGEPMADVSELDHSSEEVDSSERKLKLGPQLAAINVPTYTNDGGDEGNDTDESSVGSDESSVSSASSSLPIPCPLRPPQPITTYGPVHYKNSIPGSVTLMMDQLRFEPFNPLDMLHEGEDEDNSDHDHRHLGASAASLQYNYVEVYWDRVQKYQLTPKSSKNHLFKLIFCTSGDDNSEVVLKMKSRAELERIAEDVKTRVILPSKRKGNNSQQPHHQRRKIQKKKKKKKKQRKMRDQISTSPSSVLLTPQERSVMLPPSLPQRMISDRNLLNQASGHEPLIQTYASDSFPAAPRRPVRRPTQECFQFDFEDCDSDFDEMDEDDDDGDVDLWAIQDLLVKCQQLQRPLIFRARKRDRRPMSLLEGSDTGVEHGTTSTPLLPKEWHKLAVVPIFEATIKETEAKMQAIMVIAWSEERTILQDEEPDVVDFTSRTCLDWWVPAVTTVLRDLLQHKARLEQLSAKSKTVRDLEGKLQDSLKRYRDMILGILPPMVISKLKVQPQQWKSPLCQSYYNGQQSTSRPASVGVPVMGGVSVDDSSISGSVHSRYGLLVGGVPSQNSDSTIFTQTAAVQGMASGGNSTVESEYGLYSVSEHKPDRGSTAQLPERSSSTQTAQPEQQSFARPIPQRTNSVGNIMNTRTTMIRGLHRQGSVTNRAGATKPIFSRMDSKRGMMMMRASSARGNALIKNQKDSAKGGNLIKMDSGRWGMPRLSSLRSLHGGLSVNTGNASFDTFDQSWRTMYTDDGSLDPDDLSGMQRISALSQEVSYLTSESNVQYINSSLLGGVKDVRALYAGRKANVSIVVVSIAKFQELSARLKVESIMDVLAKLMFTVDRLCEKYRTIKVDTIGSTVVVMSGLFTGEGKPEDNCEHKAAIAALEMAKELVSEAQTIVLPQDMVNGGETNQKQSTETLKVRVGIHVGDINYGVLGQHVPQLNYFGDGDLLISLRLGETAPENCIRVSHTFRNWVGDAEKDWEVCTEVVDLSYSPLVGGFAKAAILSAATDAPSPMSGLLPLETYTIEPPPPALSGHCASSVTSSYPSLAPYGNSDHLVQLSDHYSIGGFLTVQLEESFVSGDFDVD